MTHSKLLLLITLLAGIGLGAWARDAISTEPAATSTSSFNQEFSEVDEASPKNPSNSDLLQVRADLERAEQERNELRAQLQLISDRLSALDQQPAAAIVSQPSKDASAQQRISRRRGAAALTVEVLTEAGINARDATAIKSRLDDLAMQRLYLRDQAQREGWLGKEQYRDEIRRINDAQNNLAKEFGNDNYSRYLYAMGRPNQVNVQSVIENSPAYNAGLQTGDQLVSYDNQPIYDARAIRRGSQRGTANEMIPIVVNRDGQRVELYVPRGPLGIQMASESVRPTDPP